MTYKTDEIASKCGVSVRSVTDWAKRNNVSRKGRAWDFSEEDCAEILKYYGKKPDEEAKTEVSEATAEVSEVKEAVAEATEANAEDAETAAEPKEATAEATEDSAEATEAAEDSISDIARLIESYDKQLAARDKEIARLHESMGKLIEQLQSASEAVNRLSSGYAAEKMADSQDRMLAVSSDNEGKSTFAGRLKYLFTGRL